MHTLTDDELPPPFAPYSAVQFTVDGNIVSHDPHLNDDGEALYRFLLENSQIPPVLHLHLVGTHTEYRTRTVTSTDSQGRSSTSEQTYTEHVTDFDFLLDLSPYIRTPVIQYTVPDDQPAYRGRMYKELDDHNPISGKSRRRKATRKERKAYQRLAQTASDQGLPIWSLIADRAPINPELPSLRSVKSLRQWADEYCASKKYLKEFQYNKIVYGITRASILSSVRALILGPHALYSGTLNVSFESRADKIYVRPDNRLSRALSNKWLKFLLIILLIYPFIWLWKRFSKHGGGRWSVAGGAWQIANTGVREGILIDPELTPGPSSAPPPAYAEFSSPSPSSSSFTTHAFLARWQPVILRAVRNRYQSTTPIRDSSED